MNKLVKRITPENLKLLSESEKEDDYILKKMYDWQEEYDWVDWIDFKDFWTYCNRCKGYSEGSCICYAR